MDDNWKQRLYGHSYGNIFNLRASNFQLGSDPILFSIAQSFENLLYSHTVAKENCKKLYIFENKSVFFMNPAFRTFDSDFFGDNLMSTHPQEIRNLLVSDVVDVAGRPISHQDFCNNTRIFLSENKFRTLRDACVSLVNRNSKEKIYEKPPVIFKHFSVESKAVASTYAKS